MFVPYLNEAVKVIEEGIMSVEDADKTTLCLGHKMGPLTTLDYVGLDTAMAVARCWKRNWGQRISQRHCSNVSSRPGTMA